MRPYEVIHPKRDGRPVPPEAIAELVTRYAEGIVPDYQMAAFCMAVVFRGMEPDEVATASNLPALPDDYHQRDWAWLHDFRGEYRRAARQLNAKLSDPKVDRATADATEYVLACLDLLDEEFEIRESHATKKPVNLKHGQDGPPYGPTRPVRGDGGPTNRSHIARTGIEARTYEGLFRRYAEGPSDDGFAGIGESFASGRVEGPRLKTPRGMARRAHQRDPLGRARPVHGPERVSTSLSRRIIARQPHIVRRSASSAVEIGGSQNSRSQD